MSEIQIHFGDWITIDGVPDCPEFTFDFDASLPCDGKQYSFNSPERGDFLLTYTTSFEDYEVGGGFLEIYNTQDRLEWLFEVRFGHDGDPKWEVWGFSLRELRRGEQRSMSVIKKGTGIGKSPFRRELEAALLAELESDIDKAIEDQKG